MAYYDCEDCSMNINNGGKCKSEECNCCFKRHLIGYNEEDTNNKKHDLEVAKQFYNELELLISNFEDNLIDKYNYEGILDELEFTRNELNNMVNYCPKKLKEYGYLKE